MSTTTTAVTGDTGTTNPVDPDSLAALRVLDWDGSRFIYAEGVQPYTLATPLFSDFAVKERAIQVPEGASASFVEAGVFDFPVGTRLIKSFLFPADLRRPDEDLQLIETRVLTLEEDGWDAWPYLWNEEQTEAMRAPSGAVLDISVIDQAGENVEFAYLVPQRNQCVDCHERIIDGEGVNFPIGPTARNLHVGDQLSRLGAAGIIDGVPDLSKVDSAVDWATFHAKDFSKLDDEAVATAARDYLDINCAHCHNPAGAEGVSSQLFLNYDNDDPFNYGVCKRPGSAGPGTGGFTFDIDPGNPDESILLFRMETTELGAMMPDIGRSLVDDRGIAVVREWISRLPGDCKSK
ncbi:MAG: hypothetical protein KTR31_14875 [Myxococcales bacterium]|nr:hypothetical protein [Myxococcales bacterium]